MEPSSPTIQYLKGRRKAVQAEEMSDLQQIGTCSGVFKFTIREEGAAGIQIHVMRADMVERIMNNNPNADILFVDGTFRIFK
jgi:hypothetical protein